MREFTYDGLGVRIIRSRQPFVNEAKYNCRRRSPSMEEQQDLIDKVKQLEDVLGAFMSEHNELIVVATMKCNEDSVKRQVMNIIHQRPKT